jgi:hypothetical protein
MEKINKQLNQEEYEEYIQQWKEENKELIQSGKCKKIFLECLARWENGKNKGNIKWNVNINKFVYFLYDNIEGKIQIINYKSNGQLLLVKYNDKTFNIWFARILFKKFKF